MDPFDTLGIDARFSLDLKEVEKRYRDLSRALHPDRYVGRPASERRLALNRAIAVNEAWRTVRDPMHRAQALLSRLGALPAEASTATDPELLMEMMEKREQLAEARAAKSRPSLEQLGEQMKKRQGRVLERLAASLDSPSPQGLSKASSALAELRFVQRFLEEVSAAEDELT